MYFSDTHLGLRSRIIAENAKLKIVHCEDLIDSIEFFVKMAAGFLGNVWKSLTRDPMETANKFEMMEIPAGQLRGNDYARVLDEKFQGAPSDLIYVMKQTKTSLLHVVIRYQHGQNGKMFRLDKFFKLILWILLFS